jgi:hypothetical protein
LGRFVWFWKEKFRWDGKNSALASGHPQTAEGFSRGWPRRNQLHRFGKLLRLQIFQHREALSESRVSLPGNSRLLVLKGFNVMRISFKIQVGFKIY